MKFKPLIATITLTSIVSGCSGNVSAICDGLKTHNIFYSERNHKRLLKTKNCQDCQLNGDQVDLSNLDLSGANLSGTELGGANLSDTKLTNANLSGVQFYILDGGWFGSGIYCTANLKGVDLRGALLYQARLSFIDLTSFDLSGANFEQAILSYTKLASTNLSNVNFNNASLFHADLSKANLIGASLFQADLWNANLKQSNLEGADLRGANLEQADLSESLLSNSDLRGANLLGAKLPDYKKSFSIPPKLNGAIMPDGTFYREGK